MYGMVNKSIEDMVVTAHGEATWERIKQKAKVEDEVFISFEGYPDGVTYALIGATSETLNVPASEIMEAFGIHWITKTAQDEYSDMMAASGKVLSEFLINLPNFHSRVSMIFPHLTPPRFQCSDIQEHSIRMHYFSDRAGLAPFVSGVFKGLGQRFATPVTVEQVAYKATGADHDEFIVRW